MIFDRLRRLFGRIGGNGGPSDAVEFPCEEALSRLFEFLDGELGEVARERVEAHFQACKLCYPHLQLERRFRESLELALKGEPAPERVRVMVMELLAQERGRS